MRLEASEDCSEALDSKFISIDGKANEWQRLAKGASLNLSSSYPETDILSQWRAGLLCLYNGGYPHSLFAAYNKLRAGA